MPRIKTRKRCYRCNKLKPKLEYYKHTKMAEGYLNICKDCKKADARAYRRTEQGKRVGLKGSRKYRKTEKGRETARRDQQKRYYMKSEQIKIKARRAINYEVTRGRMKPAEAHLCSECGGGARTYHHYMGYEEKNWLRVIPLCDFCHKH